MAKAESKSNSVNCSDDPTKAGETPPTTEDPSPMDLDHELPPIDHPHRHELSLKIMAKTKPFPIQDLPSELITAVVQNLRVKDVCAFRRVSVRMWAHCKPRFERMFRVVDVKWDYEGLKRLRNISHSPVLRRVVTTIRIVVSGLTPTPLDIMEILHDTSMSKLGAVENISIVIQKGCRLESKTLRSMVVAIMEASLHCYESTNRALESLTLDCPVSGVLSSIDYHGLRFRGFGKHYARYFDIVKHVSIKSLDDRHLSENIHTMLKCLKSVEVLEVEAGNMDLLYDSDYQDIRLPRLRTLRTKSRFGNDKYGREYQHIQLDNLLKFLHRHRSSLRTLSINHYGIETCWDGPPIQDLAVGGWPIIEDVEHPLLGMSINDMLPISEHYFNHQMKNLPKGLPCKAFFDYLRRGCALQILEFWLEDWREMRELVTQEIEEETRSRKGFALTNGGFLEGEDENWHKMGKTERYYEINDFEKYVETWLGGDDSVDDVAESNSAMNGSENNAVLADALNVEPDPMESVVYDMEKLAEARLDQFANHDDAKGEEETGSDEGGLDVNGTDFEDCDCGCDWGQDDEYDPGSDTVGEGEVVLDKDRW